MFLSRWPGGVPGRRWVSRTGVRAILVPVVFGAVKMRLVVRRTSYHDPPLQLTRGLPGGETLRMKAREIRGVYRYTLWSKGGLRRFDKHVEKLIAVLDDGRKFDWDDGMSNWRRSRDGQIVRAVHLGMRYSYVHEDSDEKFYEAIEDRYALGLREGLFLSKVEESARALVKVTTDVQDGKALYRVSMPSASGRVEKIAWLDPAIGFQPVRIERWASSAQGAPKLLTRTTTVNYRAFQGAVWLPIGLTTRSWRYSPQTGERVTVEEADIKAEVHTMEVNRAIDDRAFTFEGMGIDPRATIHDVRNDTYYQVAPQELADADWDAMKLSPQSKRPADVPEARIIASPQETNLTQKGIPRAQAGPEELARMALLRLLAHIGLGVVVAGGAIFALRLLRAWGARPHR